MPNKYNAKKTIVDGISFDSAKEAKRYGELKILQRAGKISDLKLQEKFVLIPAQRINGKIVERECSYIADFTYTENGRKVVEDVKGYRDPQSAGYAKFVIKRKIMLEKYGIRVREV